MSNRVYEFAKNGDKTQISASAQNTNIVSYATGYTDDYEKNLDSDPSSKRVGRENFNGILNDITGGVNEWQNQNIPTYFTTTQNNSQPMNYKRGTLVYYTDGKIYKSVIDNNNGVPTVDHDKWGEHDPFGKYVSGGYYPVSSFATGSDDRLYIAKEIVTGALPKDPVTDNTGAWQLMYDANAPYIPFMPFNPKRKYFRGETCTKVIGTAVHKYMCVVNNVTGVDPENEFQTKILVDYSFNRALSNTAQWRPINRVITDNIDGQIGEGSIIRTVTWRANGTTRHEWNGMLQANGTPAFPNPVDVTKLALLSFRWNMPSQSSQALSPHSVNGVTNTALSSGIEWQRTDQSNVYDGFTGIWYAPTYPNPLNSNETGVRCQLSGYTSRIGGTAWIDGKQYADLLDIDV